MKYRCYFFAFLRIFFNDSNFGNQGYSANDGKRESVLHDNLYEGLIVSINEPRLAESSQTSTINSASAFCTAIEKRDIKVKWTYLKLGKSPQTSVFVILTEWNVKSYNNNIS